VALEQVEWQLPTIAKASENVPTMAALLDTLPAPSTIEVSEMYQRLKSILGTTAVQQAKNSLQHRVEASILPPPIPRMGDKWLPKGPFKPTRRSIETSGIPTVPPRG
jgi:hypothetical protein